MKNIGSMFVRRYDAGDGYVVEIANAPEQIGVIECWMCHKDCGHKYYMFGLLTAQLESSDLTMIDVVEQSIDGYKKLYSDTFLYGDFWTRWRGKIEDD